MDPNHWHSFLLLICRVTFTVVFASVLTRNPDLWQQPGPSGPDDSLLERQNYWDPTFGTWWPGNTVSKWTKPVFYPTFTAKKWHIIFYLFVAPDGLATPLLNGQKPVVTRFLSSNVVFTWNRKQYGSFLASTWVGAVDRTLSSFLFPGKYLSARKVSLLKRLFSPHWGIGNFKILIYYEMDSQLSKTFPSSVCILGIEPSFW